MSVPDAHLRTCGRHLRRSVPAIDERNSRRAAVASVGPPGHESEVGASYLRECAVGAAARD
jgi:hypothetical protein